MDAAIALSPTHHHSSINVGDSEGLPCMWRREQPIGRRCTKRTSQVDSCEGSFAISRSISISYSQAADPSSARRRLCGTADPPNWVLGLRVMLLSLQMRPKHSKQLLALWQRLLTTQQLIGSFWRLARAWLSSANRHPWAPKITACDFHFHFHRVISTLSLV
jgi:hypothetical protein